MARRLAAVAVAVTLLLASCADATTDERTDPAPSTVADDVRPDTAVPELLQFSSPLVGGGELDAATTAGTPTVLWFWAPT